MRIERNMELENFEAPQDLAKVILAWSQ